MTKAQQLPGRKVFRLRAERRKPQPKDFLEGDAQKKQVKDVTRTWLAYFNEKEVNGVLFNAVQELLHLVELPENPFVFLSNHLRVSELFYGAAHEKDVTFHHNEVEPEDATTGITQVCGCPKIWGLRNVLRFVDARAIELLLRRLESLPGLLRRGEFSKGDLSLRFADALCGPAVFHGTLLPYIPDVLRLHQEVAVSGKKFEKAVTLFAGQIVEEALSLDAHHAALVAGVRIQGSAAAAAAAAARRRQRSDDSGGSSGSSSGGGGGKLWSVAKIKSSRNSFVSAVKAATVSKRSITLELVAELPFLRHNDGEGSGGAEGGPGENDAISGGGEVPAEDLLAAAELQRESAGQFAQIRKTYAMHFQQVDNTGQDSGAARSFSPFPFSSLAPGLFRSKADACYYVGLHKTPAGDCWTLSDKELFGAHYAWLQGKLVQAYVSGNLARTVEFLTCLLALDGNETIVEDVKRFMRSTAGQLRGLISWNRALQRVLELTHDDRACERGAERKGHGHHHAFTDDALLDLVVLQFSAFRKRLLDTVLATDSSEVVAMRRYVRHALYDMTDHVSKRLILDENTTLRSLKRINYICEALELTVSRDILAVLTQPFFHEGSTSGHTIVGLVEDIVKAAIGASESGSADADAEEREAAAAKANRRHGRAKKPKNNKKRVAPEGPGVEGARPEANGLDFVTQAGRDSVEAFTSEASAAQRAHANELVVSVPEEVKLAKKKRTVPGEVAREATVLRYVTDTRIDLVLKEIVRDLFTNGKLFPNPFPLVVERMRAEVARHECWTEPDIELTKVVSASRAHIKLVNHRVHLFKSARHHVYGLPSALRGCDGGVVEALIKLLELSAVISPKRGVNGEDAVAAAATSALGERAHYRTMFDTATCTSLGGSTVLLSRLLPGTGSAEEKAVRALERNPTLPVFETHVFEGPRLQGALELYADFVVGQALHANDTLPSNRVLCLATGLYAMDLMNDNPCFDGGWAPVNHHERRRTTAGAKVAAGASAAPISPGSQSHDERDWKREQEVMREQLSHPRYTHGVQMSVHQMRRERALCKQEIARATKACEPVVLHVCVLVEDPKAESAAFYVLVRKTFNFYFVQTPSGTVHSMVPPFARFETVFQSVWCDLHSATSAVEVVLSGDDPEHGRRNLEDASAPDSLAFRAFTCSLKLRAAHAFSRGDLVLAYRAMLKLGLLENRRAEIPGLLRMLRPGALSLELDLLVHSSELMKALFHERTKADESRRKIKGKVLKAQFATYRTGVEDLLARTDCVFMPGMRNAVHALLLRVDQAIQTDRGSSAERHVERLEEIQTYLECIRIASAHAVHRNCPHVDNALRGFAQELLSMSELAFVA